MNMATTSTISGHSQKTASQLLISQNVPSLALKENQGLPTLRLSLNLPVIYAISIRAAIVDPLDPLSCLATPLCCTHVNIGTDLEPIWVNRDCTIKDPLLSCDPQVEVMAYCKDYADNPTSVFTVGDFVGYLWSMDNNGVKLLQVRFYPQ
jgi:hypothetical protein